MRASETAELIFDNCRVHKSQIIGNVGDGFKQAMKILDGGRISIGALSMGIAKGAFEAAVKYAKEREQFGQPIANFQAIAFKLADMALEIEASEVLYKKESMERAIIFVTKGTLVEFTASGDNIEYRSGAILGVEQFLFNKKWENTIICETAAVVLKFKWETLRDLQQRNATLAVNAARIY